MSKLLGRANTIKTAMKTHENTIRRRVHEEAGTSNKSVIQKQLNTIKINSSAAEFIFLFKKIYGKIEFQWKNTTKWKSIDLENSRIFENYNKFFALIE